MKYLSVCSGIEAATVAWDHLGWQASAYSEIEPFPSAVLAHHYPTVPNVGDMTKYKEWNLDGSIDLLVGGTPCQSFSVAGLRKGLDDPRGNLALTYVGILDHFRPKWFVWENVPGVLSSSGGRDFGAFLGALAEIGYGFAYRVLDAQHFGVPQRRRRVFVVGCLGNWESAAKVLFESESLSGNTKQGRKTGKETSNYVANCAGTLLARDYKGLSSDDVQNGKVVVEVYENHPSDSRIAAMGDVCSTVTSRWGTGGGNVPYVQSYAIQGSMIGRNDNAGPQGNGINEEVSFTLNTTDRHGVVAPTLTTNDPSRSPRAIEVTNQVAAVYAASMQVRRLTPIECERLQGFPDNYTQIPWRKKESTQCPDGPRYKSLGNSMAVPVMRWIGERIEMVRKL